ncbi:MAG: DedA family protein [Mesorhizobium sp.]|uniref:YqaA family protein n=1 Tax=Mesorhizobium sp. TaxID=1871066 RepID=UPI001AC670B2|nr:YqaA family protein [Mesorhizobium sp.]MBN9221502.1 DedA family protein [Mesorhizobium sp.]
MTALYAYAGLFLSALVAATILPAQSEAVLAALLASKAYSTLLLLTVASAGNILGAVINWFLGRGIEAFADRRWFPVKPAALQSAMKWYHRYGRWSLLGSWLPVVGDPLTLVAGVLREPFWSFLVLVSIGKIARYAVLAAIVLSWT